MLKTPELRLRPGADRRLKQGHCWIYSNEVDSEHTPLGSFAAGDPVTIVSAAGQVLGTALMEPQSLICARLLDTEPDVRPSVDWLLPRLRAAQSLRARYFEQPYYRWIYGDSDGLSGVVVDRFGDYLVLQLNTAGAESYCGMLVDALIELAAPTGILLRADSRSRRDQGLPSHTEVVFGEVPERVELVENDVKFLAPVVSGQKTGWFYDHRENRRRLKRLCQGARVLDVYSYVGGWGVQAACAGAGEVHCIDTSAAALELAQENASLNGVAGAVTAHAGRADSLLRELGEAGERFDIVVLDPPAFVQRRKDLGKGRKAYQRINELALKLLAPGGLLVSASCSMHLPQEDLIAAVAAAARRTATRLTVSYLGGQAADHPIHPVIPETRYLKTLFGDLSRAD